MGAVKAGDGIGIASLFAVFRQLGAANLLLLAVLRLFKSLLPRWIPLSVSFMINYRAISMTLMRSGAAGGLGGHGLADMRADERRADRGLVGELAVGRIGFRRANNGIRLFVIGFVFVNDGHARAETDDVRADLALVHDDGVLDHRFQLGDALLQHGLIVLRCVVFGVLAQVAVGNGNFQLLGDLHFFSSLFVFKLFLHALKAFAGNNHMLGIRHNSISPFLCAPCKSAAKRAPEKAVFGHTAIFYDYTLRVPVCQSMRMRKMQAVTGKRTPSRRASPR